MENNNEPLLYRWVKASDRTPENEKHYLIKFYDSYELAEYRNDTWFKKGTNYLITHDTYKYVEWLEPYTPPVAPVKRCEYELLVEKYFGIKLTYEPLPIEVYDHTLVDLVCATHQHFSQFHPVAGSIPVGGEREEK